MKKNKIQNVIFRLCALAACVIIVVSLAMTRQAAVTSSEGGSAARADTATVTTLKDGVVKINTTNIGKGVKGYGGPTPLLVFIKDGKVDSIAALPNTESPEFFSEVVDKVLSRYKGKTVDQALTMHVDCVTGSTFTSKALKANVALALQEAKHQNVNSGFLASLETAYKDATPTDLAKCIVALIVALMAAILPLFIKNKTYRTVQQILDVAVLGMWAGSFVSYSSLIGLVNNGVMLTTSIALLVLVVVAFVYPLFGKKSYYCSWCCPMGASQELVFAIARQTGRRPITFERKGRTRIKIFRMCLWAVLMCLTWFGVTSHWMDYEIFSAFLWESASWIMIAFLVVTLVVSFFIPRPYCTFLCPTGTLLKMV